VPRPDLRPAGIRGHKAISRQIREIFAEHTPIIEPLSLDEAYLGVTENLQGIPLARDIPVRIRERSRPRLVPSPWQALPTTSSWQISHPITAKTNGQFVISPEIGPLSSSPCLPVDSMP
jgi:DNA polymerase-4